MTKAGDKTELLIQITNSLGQAAVARELGYSPSAINQALKGTYGGRLDNLLQKVAEVYGDDSVNCPVMGEISLRRCASERRKPFSASSPQRTRLWQACKQCDIHRKTGGKDE